MRGDYNVGGLLGQLGVTASINQSHSSASVSAGGLRVGGLVGWSQALSTMDQSYATGSVVGPLGMNGGFIGRNEGDITDSYASGHVRGPAGSGGFVGFNRGNISRSYSFGDVAGTPSIGGFVGIQWSATISDCFAHGDVTGTGGSADSVGGFVGWGSNGTITRSYSTGAPTGLTNVGGFVGLHSAATITNSFWDTTSSGTGASPAGSPLNTANMQTEVNFTGAGWDWVGESGNGNNDYWVMPTDADSIGYPRLTNNYQCYGANLADAPYANSASTPAGTEADPFLICTGTQMNQIGLNSADWDKYFLVGDDIDLSAFTGTLFNRIGTGPDFTGVFDGNARNGFAVDGYNPTAASFLSLFDTISGTGVKIKSLRLTNVNIVLTGASFTGGIALTLRDGSIIEDSSVSGSIQLGGSGASGGLVATTNAGSTIRRSWANVNLSGGTLGSSSGGLVGHGSGLIEDSYSEGSLTGSTAANGGFVGMAAAGTRIVNSYSTASTANSITAGGLVGNAMATASETIIQYCWAAGSIAALGSPRGLSFGTGIVADSYWDSTTTGQASSDGGGTGLATGAMQMEASFAGWDFVGETANGSQDIWHIDEGADYPRLYWEAR